MGPKFHSSAVRSGLQLGSALGNLHDSSGWVRWAHKNLPSLPGAASSDHRLGTPAPEKLHWVPGRSSENPAPEIRFVFADAAKVAASAVAVAP